MNGIHLEPYKFSKIHFLLWILSTYSTSQKGINKQVYRISTKPTLNYTDWSFPWTVDTSDVCLFFFPPGVMTWQTSRRFRRRFSSQVTAAHRLLESFHGMTLAEDTHLGNWQQSRHEHTKTLSLYCLCAALSFGIQLSNKRILTKSVNKTSAQFPSHL